MYRSVMHYFIHLYFFICKLQMAFFNKHAFSLVLISNILFGSLRFTINHEA
jgi:hypothetical protein